MKQYTNPGGTLAAKWAELGRKAAKHFTSVCYMYLQITQLEVNVTS